MRNNPISLIPVNEFYQKLAEIVDAPEVKSTDVLADFSAWDSLSVLSTIAMAGSTYGVVLNASDLKNASTAGALWDLVNSRRAGSRG